MVGQHYEGGQILVHAAQSITHPASHAGKTGKLEPSRLQVSGLAVHACFADKIVTAAIAAAKPAAALTAGASVASANGNSQTLAISKAAATAAFDHGASSLLTAITHAAILAGDSDFIPAVEAAKSEGVVVHLFYGPRAHRDLISVCDERTYITKDLLSSLSRRRTHTRALTVSGGTTSDSRCK